MCHPGEGSSPLARGTLKMNLCIRLISRFIPACAGNSGEYAVVKCVKAVHPRLRGELIFSNSMALLYPGSSPLARGTLTLLGATLFMERFIPACAGNSSYRQEPEWRRSVHPRLRGELPEPRKHRLSYSGSSPLARGTHSVRFV